jgi:hypothetical protein
MSIYSGVVGVRLGQDNRPLADGRDVLSRRWHILARATVITAGCLALLILIVMAFAKTGTMPSFQPLQQLLPGGPLPATAVCMPGPFHHAECKFAVDGKDVALSFNTLTGAIKAIVSSGTEYRLGDLVLAWGTRTAGLYTCALEPGSSVTYLEYTFTPHPLSAWRGFTTRP